MQVALDLFHEGGDAGGIRHILADGRTETHRIDLPERNGDI